MARDRLASLFCCLPGIEAPASLAYKDTFKVAIIQFLDRFNFDLGTVKRSCIHFATPDGRMIPFDTYQQFLPAGRAGRGEAARKGGRWGMSDYRRRGPSVGSVLAGLFLVLLSLCLIFAGGGCTIMVEATSSISRQPTCCRGCWFRLGFSAAAWWPCGSEFRLIAGKYD